MSHMHVKANRKEVVVPLLLCLVIAFLSGCIALPDEKLSTPESEPVLATPIVTAFATPAPTVYVSPTMLVEESDPFPFSLDEVTCYFDTNTMQDYDHWADAFVPGVSTIDDFLALSNLPDDLQPERTGLWRYWSDTDNARLDFEHGILYEKGDPRTKLGEIVQHYGLPEKIVWEIPRRRYDGASYATYLVYPEHRAIFFAWDKVIWFTPNTDFGYSNFYTQEDFNAKLSALTYADYNRYVESDWPCGE